MPSPGRPKKADDEDGEKKGKKTLGAKRSASKTKKGSADDSEPAKELDRVRVYLKISSEHGSSVSSCVTCNSQENTAWALDFDGQRVSQGVTLDGVYGADTHESSVYPEVVHTTAAAASAASSSMANRRRARSRSCTARRVRAST